MKITVIYDEKRNLTDSLIEYFKLKGYNRS